MFFENNKISNSFAIEVLPAPDKPVIHITIDL
jgi:hypothetical protein